MGHSISWEYPLFSGPIGVKCQSTPAANRSLATSSSAGLIIERRVGPQNVVLSYLEDKFSYYPPVLKRGNWKSTRNRAFNRKITINSVFSIAMFDYRRVHIMKHMWSTNGVKESYTHRTASANNVPMCSPFINSYFLGILYGFRVINQLLIAYRLYHLTPYEWEFLRCLFHAHFPELLGFSGWPRYSPGRKSPMPKIPAGRYSWDIIL